MVVLISQVGARVLLVGLLWVTHESVAELGLHSALSCLPLPRVLCYNCQAEESWTTPSHVGPWGVVSQRVTKWAALQ